MLLIAIIIIIIIIDKAFFIIVNYAIIVVIAVVVVDVVIAAIVFLSAFAGLVGALLGILLPNFLIPAPFDVFFRPETFVSCRSRMYVFGLECLVEAIYSYVSPCARRLDLVLCPVVEIDRLHFADLHAEAAMDTRARYANKDAAWPAVKHPAGPARV